MIKKDTDTRPLVRYKKGPSIYLDLNPYLTCIIEDKSIIAIAGHVEYKSSNLMRLYCLKTLKPMKTLSYASLHVGGLRYVSELDSLMIFGRNSIILFKTTEGFRTFWNHQNNLETESIDFVFDEGKILAVGRFPGVIVLSLKDPKFQEHKLPNNKLFACSVAYVKSCEKVLLMTRQRIAITNWPAMESMTHIEADLNMRSKPIHSLSYIPRYKLLAAYYYESATKNIWRIAEGSPSNESAGSNQNDLIPLKYIGVSLEFLAIIGYVPEQRTLIGLGESGALALSRLPDGLVQTHFEDYCNVTRPKYWESKKMICFISRSSAFVPTFSLRLRYL